MLEPLFLAPVLQDKIWGGTTLASLFGFELPTQTIGEAWCISAHPHGVTQVISPERYRGIELSRLYQECPTLFGEPTTKEFPLLVKLLDAKSDLSVQVHPADDYALYHEQELGKNECWYIVQAQPNAKIVYGHRATSRAEFEQLVAQGKWQELLVEVPVKAGDFFDVPAGTIHAIGAGIVILETQQSSDTTYRVYDYERVDDAGQKRPLHLAKAADVTAYPDFDRTVESIVSMYDGGTVTQLVANDYFTVMKWQVASELLCELNGAYTLATVISGAGELWLDERCYPVQAGQSFILPHGIRRIQLVGDLTIISSHPNNKGE